MKFLFPFALAILILAPSAMAEPTEQIFVSGGPSLRTFERFKEHPHDRFWGNFITSGVSRYQEIQSEIGNQPFTWLIFKPAYVRRADESGHDLMAEIKKMVAPTGARIVWFHNRAELIDYLHSGKDRSTLKIGRLEYFGHSNKRNWCFDYSNAIDGAVMESMCLHVDHLGEIRGSVFAESAYTRSWGCHSGEQFSQAWRKATGVPMWGAIGKTDYSNGTVPIISTPGGNWTQ